MTRQESEALCDQELSRIVLNEFNRMESMLKRQRPGKVLRTKAKATPEQPDVVPDPDLFDDEEERFIVETAAWLKPRENKDTILERIWNVLTEENPDAYFQPDESDAPAEPLPVADAGEEEQNRPEHE